MVRHSTWRRKMCSLESRGPSNKRRKLLAGNDSRARRRSDKDQIFFFLFSATPRDVVANRDAQPDGRTNKRRSSGVNLPVGSLLLRVRKCILPPPPSSAPLLSITPNRPRYGLLHGRAPHFVLAVDSPRTNAGHMRENGVTRLRLPLLVQGKGRRNSGRRRGIVGDGAGGVGTTHSLLDSWIPGF